jgi:hypothetical protein
VRSESYHDVLFPTTRQSCHAVMRSFFLKKKVARGGERARVHLSWDHAESFHVHVVDLTLRSHKELWRPRDLTTVLTPLRPRTALEIGSGNEPESCYVERQLNDPEICVVNILFCFYCFMYAVLCLCVMYVCTYNTRLQKIKEHLKAVCFQIFFYSIKHTGLV